MVAKLVGVVGGLGHEGVKEVGKHGGREEHREWTQRRHGAKKHEERSVLHCVLCVSVVSSCLYQPFICLNFNHVNNLNQIVKTRE